MNKFLKPAPGRTVDQLSGEPWPAEGMEAEDTIFTRRCLRNGDLVECERPAAPQEAAVETTETQDAGEPAKSKKAKEA